MPYGIASFRSRQQVFAFESALKRTGIRAQVISTPREVSLGCGLSVRFELSDLNQVASVYYRVRPSNVIGFYQVEEGYGRRSKLVAIQL